MGLGGTGSGVGGSAKLVRSYENSATFKRRYGQLEAGEEEEEEEEEEESTEEEEEPGGRRGARKKLEVRAAKSGSKRPRRGTEAANVEAKGKKKAAQVVEKGKGKDKGKGKSPAARGTGKGKAARGKLVGKVRGCYHLCYLDARVVSLNGLPDGSSGHTCACAAE